jgi:hypothetical protein
MARLRFPMSRPLATAATSVAVALLLGATARAEGEPAVPSAPPDGNARLQPALPRSSASAAADPDLPELLSRLLGRPRLATGAEKRFHLAVLPFVLANPLLGAGGGLAAVGGFRLGGPETAFSRFETSAFLTTHRQEGVVVRTDVRLPGNGWILSGDWGGGRFPNPAYGLGGETRSSDRTVVQRQQIQLHETVYRRVVSQLYGGLGYLVDDFYDIVDVRHAAGEATRFSAYPYGTSGRSLSSGVTLNVLWDGRDSTVRPTRGASILGRFRFEPAELGSDDAWYSYYLDARTYLAVPGRGDVLALWAFGWWSSARTPYLLLPQVGADPEHRSARGMVEGRYAARDLVYGEVEYRAHLWRSLGAVAALSLSAPSDRGVNGAGLSFRAVHPGLAAGLRVLLDRTSGANLVLDGAWAPGEGVGFYLNANETF